MNGLAQYLADSARKTPDATAVVEPGHGSLSYAELDALAARLATD